MKFILYWVDALRPSGQKLSNTAAGRPGFVTSGTHMGQVLSLLLDLLCLPVSMWSQCDPCHDTPQMSSVAVLDARNCKLP